MSSRPSPPFSGQTLGMGNQNPRRHKDEVFNQLKAVAPQISTEVIGEIPKSLPPTTSVPGPPPVRATYPNTSAGLVLFEAATARHDLSIGCYNTSTKHRHEKDNEYARATSAIVQTLTPHFFDQLKAQKPQAVEAWTKNDPLSLLHEVYLFLDANSSGGSKYSTLNKSLREVAEILGKQDVSNLIDSSSRVTEEFRKLRAILSQFTTDEQWNQLAAASFIESLSSIKFSTYKTSMSLIMQNPLTVDQVPGNIQNVVTQAILSLGVGEKRKSTKSPAEDPPAAANSARGSAPTGNIPAAACTNCGKPGHHANTCWAPLGGYPQDAPGGGGRGGGPGGRGRGGGGGGRGDGGRGTGGPGGRGRGGGGGGRGDARNPKRGAAGQVQGGAKKTKKTISWNHSIRTVPVDEDFSAGTIDDDINSLSSDPRSSSSRSMGPHYEAPDLSQACTTTPDVPDVPELLTIATGRDCKANPKDEQPQLQHGEIQPRTATVKSKDSNMIYYGLRLCLAAATLIIFAMCAISTPESQEHIALFDRHHSHLEHQVPVPDPLYGNTTFLREHEAQEVPQDPEPLVFHVHYWGDLVLYQPPPDVTWYDTWDNLTIYQQIYIAEILMVMVGITTMLAARLFRQQPTAARRRANVLLLPRANFARGKPAKVSHDSGTQVTVIASGDPYAGEVRPKRLSVRGVGGGANYTHEVFHKLFKVWGAQAKANEIPASLISTRDIEHLHDFDGTFVERDGRDEHGNAKFRVTHHVWTNRSKTGPDLIFERVKEGEDSDLLIFDPVLTMDDL